MGVLARVGNYGIGQEPHCTSAMKKGETWPESMGMPRFSHSLCENICLTTYLEFMRTDIGIIVSVQSMWIGL